MIYLADPLIITFSIVTPVVCLAIIAIFVILPLRKKYIKKHFDICVYRVAHNIALNKDFYLINNFVFTLTRNEYITINHILFGDKYIYVLLDKFYNGTLTGKEEDSSCVLVNKNGEKKYIDNPLESTKRILNYLCDITGLPKDLMIGLTIVNDDCKVMIESDSNKYFVSNKKELNRIVKLIESRDVANINEEKLQEAVLVLDKINKRNKEK